MEIMPIQIASPRVAKTKPKQKWREPPLGPPREVVAGMPFFHARTHMPMTKQEVKLILADPKSLPDSDDEEDVDKWKVTNFCSQNSIGAQR